MHRLHKLLSFTTWAYLASTVLALILMCLAGDHWWPATMLLFGPRWAVALPIIPLLPLVLWRRPRLLIPLVLGSFVVFGPFMGLRCAVTIPVIPDERPLRVLSCNVGGKNFDAQKLSRLIVNLDVDIASLQECPRGLHLDLTTEWHVVLSGSLAVYSKYPLKAYLPFKGIPTPGKWPLHPILACAVATDKGDILFNAMHLPTARYGLENMLDRTMGLNFKKAGYLISETQKRSHISKETKNSIDAQTLPVIIAGDFNMPVESAIYRQHWSQFRNAFASSGRGYGFTSVDIHKGIPIPIRIDHILTANGLTSVACEVCPDVGSDHRPVIADIVWK